MSDETHLCDVCGKREPCGVASSYLGPVSLACCVNCLMEGAQPAWMLGMLVDADPDNLESSTKQLLQRGRVADWVYEVPVPDGNGSYMSVREWMNS